jgi:carbamoylphosphate synthase small subunit
MVINMEIDFNAKKAKELTKTVKETNRILKNVSKQNFLWDPIIRSIQNGSNTVVMLIDNEKEVNFLNELKELGYKVTIDEKRFYNEAIIKW